MRFLFNDAERVRRVAKSLKAALAGHGIDRPLHECRKLTALACGYPTFHEAEASAGKAGYSPVDEASSPETVKARKAHQRGVLLQGGVPEGIVDAVLDEVRFTGAVRRGVAAPVPAEPVATARQDRVRDRVRGGGLSLRAGNFNAYPVVDAGGRWIGFSFGSDYCYEHDLAPEALFEAMSVPEGAATVGEAVMRPGPGEAVRLSDDGDPEHATVLLLNRPSSHIGMDDGLLRRDDFSDGHYHRRWKSNGHKAPYGAIVSWNYESLVLVGFEPEVRERIRDLAEAVRDGRTSVTFSPFHGDGPLLLRADRLDPDLPLKDAVRAVHAAQRERMRGGQGHVGPLRVDLPSASPVPALSIAALGGLLPRQEDPTMTDFRPAFDREDAEWSVQDYLQVTVGHVEILASKAMGIVAFERLSGDDDRKLDWDKFARDLSEMTGRTVLNVSDCDWSFDDRHDEEATYVAFDVDGLDRSYLTPERNKLSEAYMASVAPGPAPAP